MSTCEPLLKNVHSIASLWSE